MPQQLQHVGIIMTTPRRRACVHYAHTPNQHPAWWPAQHASEPEAVPVQVGPRPGLAAHGIML